MKKNSFHTSRPHNPEESNNTIYTVSKPHFPFLPKRKSMLFHSIEIQRKMKAKSQLSHSTSKQIHQHHNEQQKSPNHSINTLEVPIVQNSYNDTGIRKFKDEENIFSTKMRFNSTYRKIIMSRSFDKEEDRWAKNKDVTRYNTIDRSVERVVHNRFTPKMGKINLSKRNDEILDQYMARFAKSEENRKMGDQLRKKIEKSNYDLLSDGKHFQQLQRLGEVLNQRRSLVRSKESITLIQGEAGKYLREKKCYQKKPSFLGKKLTSKMKIKFRNKPDSGDQMVDFSPWNHHNQEEQYL